MKKIGPALRPCCFDRHRFKQSLLAAFTPVILALVMLSHAQTVFCQSNKPIAILAGQYVAPDGSLQPGAAIVLSSGKIKAIRSTKLFKNLPGVIDRSDAVICPGLIDVRSTMGVYQNNIETAYAIDPSTSMIDAIDWHHPDLASALQAGITTAMIVPSDANIVSGASAVVKTALYRNKPIILDREGPLMFAVGRSVNLFDRAPTSQIGALSMLRNTLDRAKSGQGHERLQSFVRGGKNAMVVCGNEMDVSAALKTMKNLGRAVSIAYTGDVHQLANEISKTDRSVVMGPFAFSMSSRTLSIASTFDEAGIPVVFAGGTPAQSADGLRTTAALAVRYGMNPDKARLAITMLAAKVAGVDHRVGSIKPGLDADLVVFSGDPLRLDSRVLEVYIQGERVYRYDGDRIASTTGATP